jgi:hypothetical protein
MYMYKLDDKSFKTTIEHIPWIWKTSNALITAQVAEAPNVNAFKNRLDIIMQDFMYSVVEPPTLIRSDQKISIAGETGLLCIM